MAERYFPKIMKSYQFDSKDALKLRFRKSPNMVFRRIVGECVLVPVSASADDVDSIYALNEVAADIWEMLGPEKTLEMILSELTDMYQVDIDSARTDLMELIEDLDRIGAIEAT